ncbi:MAG: hypothetical protein AAB967_02080, partial [Patescibacteria group bacterium]
KDEKTNEFKINITAASKNLLKSLLINPCAPTTPANTAKKRWMVVNSPLKRGAPIAPGKLR